MTYRPAYLLESLAKHFGPEWKILDASRKRLVLEDFKGLCEDNYDVADPTVDYAVAQENIDAAGAEHRKNIGADNLYSYAGVLAVHLKQGEAAK